VAGRVQRTGSDGAGRRVTGPSSFVCRGWFARSARRLCGTLCLPLAQPRARSAVVRINEDDSGLFERPLHRFEGAWPHRVPALETRHRLRRHLGRTGEVPEVPAQRRPRVEPQEWEPSHPRHQLRHAAGLPPVYSALRCRGADVVLSSALDLALSTFASNSGSGNAASFFHFEDCVLVTPRSSSVGGAQTGGSPGGCGPLPPGDYVAGGYAAERGDGGKWATAFRR
jgi:hypothetical protein